MKDKVKKTFYIPDWVAVLIDGEGQRYDGPGVVASAAIAAFSQLSDDQKMETLQKFRNLEIRAAYQNSDLSTAKTVHEFMKKNWK